MRNAAKRQDDAELRQSGDASFEELPAMGDLARGGLVRGRHAAHGVGDHAVDKRERLWPRGIVYAAGQSNLKKGAVEQLSGVISEERPSGAVRALQSWREPHDEQPRIVAPE